MDLRQRVFGDRNALKRLIGSIPGYDGYQQKEMRRDADKLLRNQIAAKLIEEQRRLNEQKVQLVSSGQLLAIGPLDRASTKLQLLIDRIKTATYGYAGWFDAITVQDADLDALYDFDNALGEDVSRVAEGITRLGAAIAEKGSVANAANELISVVDGLNAQFSRRQDFLVEGKRPPTPALDVLAPKAALTQEGLSLASLKLNDAVTYEGIDYLVSGKVTFAGKGQAWNSYLIKDNQTERWLWVGDVGNTIGLLDPFSPGMDLTASPSPSIVGEQYTLAEQGSAEATIEGPSGRRSGIFVAYWSFTSPSDKLLWVEKWAEGVKSYSGKRVSPEDLKVWKR